MQFTLSTIAAAAAILSAAEAAPHRGWFNFGDRHRDHSDAPFPFPSGFGSSLGPFNPTGFPAPTGGFPSGPRPTGGFPAPTGGFPSGRPGAPSGTGFPPGIPSGVPSGIPSGVPSGVPDAPPATSFPTFPTGDLSSVSFELPSSVAAEAEESEVTATVVPTSASGGNSSTPVSTFLPASGAATTTFPEAAGSSSLSEPMVVTGEFDGGMVRFDRGTPCNGQNEGGDSDAVFQIEEGGTLKNVIIGADQSEGVHCMGSCTIENVWWEDVCEDALTIKQDSGVSYVIGGGAKGADDKVVQHNGGGTVSISNFYVADFGKLYRSCGNCETQHERHVIIDGVVADGGSATLVGINSNYGDTATITNSCITNTKDICQEFTGNDSGDEPEKISSGISDACIYTEADVATC